MGATLLKGTIAGMESMGAKFIKTDGFDLFFEIPKGGVLDDDVKLKRAKNLFQTRFDLGLRVRRVEIKQ